MLNVIAVMGRLVADPELRKTPTGVSTCKVTIACERSYTPKGQERQTDFFDIVAWRGTAEFVCKYMSKGQLIAVNGSLQTRSYEDKSGNKRKVYEILADTVHFGESKQKPAERARPDVPAATADDFAVVSDEEDLPF